MNKGANGRGKVRAQTHPNRACARCGKTMVNPDLRRINCVDCADTLALERKRNRSLKRYQEKHNDQRSRTPSLRAERHTKSS
jgi:DNA-directed RNA polymerase subunit M/transcription elongation factor TFIIS